jgi:TetR/AcrR family tetracycline transcriptional repressor
MPCRRIDRPVTTATPVLNQDEIIHAALRLAKKLGAEKLTMRALAIELGVSTMAVYYYVPSKDALLDLLVEAVLSLVPMPAPEPERWQEQLKACTLAAFSQLYSYPGLSRVMVQRANFKVGRNVVRYNISVLLAAGFDHSQAALALSAFNTYVYGVYAGMDLIRTKAAHAGRKPRRGPTSPLENVSAVLAELESLDLAQSFHFGMDAVLAGIAALSGNALNAAKPSE